MSRARLVWQTDEEKFPKTSTLLHAVPGVGNVGKVVTDALVNTHESVLIARILHPDLPPHATLDDEGLLTPPSLNIHKVNLPSGDEILTLNSNFQPLTPAGQYEVASALLDCCRNSEIEKMYILAGLSADPGCEAVHVVCSSKEDMIAMEGLGISVSKEHPSAGIIGMTGMVSSLAPTFDQPSACIIAETIGTSVDTVAADRLVQFIKNEIGLDLGLELDNTEDSANKLRAFFDLDEIAEMPADFLAEGESQQTFYA